MEIRIPRGTVDLCGEALARVERVEGAARLVFARFGYREIRGPLFEETRLFARATGLTSDIVEKEMFSIPRDGESYSLRPEGTPSVVRHYIESSLAKEAPFQKFCYLGPMFRYERPQAGRQRQFHQVGVEAFGSADPLLDAEIVLVQDRFFRELGVAGQEVRINTLGCRECRPAYRQSLLDELSADESRLCVNCRRRKDVNPLRVLDCKEEVCREIGRGLPRLPELVCDECRAHHQAVLSTLAAAGVHLVEDPFLVRGLDYYSRTVFETVHPALGARSSICGGGRYDGLVEDLGGPPTPAAGFAIGVEPTLLALERLGAEIRVEAPSIDVFVVAVKAEVREAVFQLVAELRDVGFRADMDYEGRGMKAQMKKADRANARFAAILGPGERERGTVTLRRLSDGSQDEVPAAELAERLR